MCGIYFLMQKIVQENKNNMQNNYEKKIDYRRTKSFIVLRNYLSFFFFRMITARCKNDQEIKRYVTF